MWVADPGVGHSATTTNHRTEQWFTARPDQVKAARQWVTEVLDGCDADIIERAALITTELAANVLDHARSDQIGVSVGRDGEVVRIEIIDCDPTGSSPSAQSLEPTSIRGRGLLIVEAMSSSWGVLTAVDRKIVWAEL